LKQLQNMSEIIRVLLIQTRYLNYMLDINRFVKLRRY
jgi:hypothetical protein